MRVSSVVDYVISGDSLGGGDFPAYIRRGIKVWPDCLPWLEGVHFNTCKSAWSNEIICNDTIDAIIEHKPHTVICLWAEDDRDNLYDHQFVLTRKRERYKYDDTEYDVLEATKHLVEDEEVMDKLRFKNLRAIWKLYDFCKGRGIQLIHGMNRPNKKWDHYYWHTINEDPNFMGWDFSMLYHIMNLGYTISDVNQHPNQLGMLEIADMVEEFVSSRKRPEPNVDRS